MSIEGETAPGMRWIELRPERQPWALEAVLRDPDGNAIVLQQR